MERVSATWDDPRRVALGRVIQVLQRKGWSAPSPTEQAVDAILQDIDGYAGVGRPPTGGEELFTPQQELVLEKVAEGKSHEEIAAELRIGRETVKHHVMNAVKRSGCRNVTHAVAVALTLGLIEPPRFPRQATELKGAA